MLVISLVGPIGVGKTTLVDFMNKMGYTTLSEDYMEFDEFRLDNTLMLSKWFWINNWFNRVLRILKNNANEVVVTDRSVIEAGMWSENTESVMPAIMQTMKELKQLNVDFMTIYLACDRQVLWQRVQTRIESDPARFHYKENDYEYFSKLYESYEKWQHLWDVVIDVTFSSPKEIYNKISQMLPPEAVKFE